MMNLQELKFPIGPFTKPDDITQSHLKEWIDTLENFPATISKAVSMLDNNQLENTYRPEGWTIRQLVHHCADSHMNSFIRLKLTLTEKQPTIKPYMQDRWSELFDTKEFPIQASLHIIEGVHQRWVALLKQLDEKELKRTYIHPEYKKEFSIEENMGLYAWHCKHHLAHILNAIKNGAEFK